MIRYLTNWWYKKYPPKMVSWWMYKEAVQGKVTTAKDGSYIMWMEGEKYPFPGYPRGHLLYGSLSPLKHEIKNQVFNDSWQKLEDGATEEEVMKDLKEDILTNITALGKASRSDMLPIERCSRAVREIYRAWAKVGGNEVLRDIVCYIFQEDDAYRFRFQWLSKYLKPSRPKSSFAEGMKMLEHAEIVDDMKGRVRLWERILSVIFRHDDFFGRFLKELNFKEVKLSKADKYFFRAKYFKVDYPYKEY